MNKKYSQDVQLIKLVGKFGVDEEDTQAVADVRDHLEMAEQIAMSHCNRADIVEGMAPAIRYIATTFYNEEGSEGESSRSGGGVSRSFDEGIPYKAKSMLSSYRLANARKLGG